MRQHDRLPVHGYASISTTNTETASTNLDHERERLLAAVREVIDTKDAWDVAIARRNALIVHYLDDHTFSRRELEKLCGLTATGLYHAVVAGDAARS